MKKQAWIVIVNDFKLKESDFKSGYKPSQAIWSPTKGKDDRDRYGLMRKVKKDDVIITLSDKKLFSKVSLSKNTFIEKNINFSEWAGDIYHINIHNNSNLNPPLIKKDLFRNSNQLLLEKISKVSTVFYTKNFSLRQGAYITPCSKELLTFLNNEYKLKSKNYLPHVSSDMIYDLDNDELLSHIIDNEEEIQFNNNNIGSEQGSSIVAHNNGVEKLRKILEKDLSFDYVEKLVKLKKGGDIDLIALHERTLLVFEYKHGKTNLSKEYTSFLGKQRKHKTFLLDEHSKLNDRFDKICFIYVAYNVATEELNKIYNAKLNDGYITHDPNEHIVSGKKIRDLGNYCYKFQAIDQFGEMGRKIDATYAKRHFIVELNIKPEKDDYIYTPAIRSMINVHKNQQLFVFNCSAKELSKFASVSRRRVGSTKIDQYQRLIDGNRLTKISGQFLDEGNNFVNNIIIKINPEYISFQKFVVPKNDKFKGVNKKYEFGVVKIKADYNSCWVIDGQHRLFSYLKTTNENIDDTINVSGLVNIDEVTEAKYFIAINDNSKKVQPDLIWDINGQLDRTSTDGIISNAVKKIHTLSAENNIFFENIKIPSLANRARYSFANFCRTLKDDCEIIKNEYWVNQTLKEKKFKNPFLKNNPNQTINLLSKAYSDFFIHLNSKLSEKLIFELYNDAVIAQLCMIAKDYFIFHKTAKILNNDNAEYKKPFFDCLSDIFIKMGNDQIKEIRAMASTQKKMEAKHKILNELQQNYDSTFGEKRTSELVQNSIKFIERDLKEWTFNYIYNKYGVNVITESGNFNSELPKFRKKMGNRRISGDENIWMVADNRIFKNILFDKNFIIKNKKNIQINLWKDAFYKIFIDDKEGNGFSGDAEFQSKMKIIEDYRSDCFAHLLPGEKWELGDARDVYHPTKRESVKNALDRFYLLMI